MKKIFYWSPFINDVATVKSVINSCIGFKNYEKKFVPYIINCFGEFDKYIEIIKNNNVNIINLNVSKELLKFPSEGFIFSRIKYLLIFFLSFKKLSNLIKKDNPDFFVAHLITSLPIFLFKINNFKSKLILRISGYPKLNILRKLLWKLCNNKISLITSPTRDTCSYLIKNKIFISEKIFVLEDPIINISEIIKLRKEKFMESDIKINKYLLGIGRLTEQKNFELLINLFYRVKKTDKEIKLVILGVGENLKKLQQIVNKKNLKNHVKFLGFKKNVFKYLYNSKSFILTSKWEDPGFVLIEAAISRATIISSDCPNGPKEFIGDNKSGYLFKSNNIDDLEEKFKDFEKISKHEIIKIKLNALKSAKKYTIFQHTKNFTKILNFQVN